MSDFFLEPWRNDYDWRKMVFLTPGRVALAMAAPQLVRALLSVEWTDCGEGTFGDGFCCPSCRASGVSGTTVFNEQTRMFESGTDLPADRHKSSCPVDAALTVAGFPDQESRDEARKMMAGP